MMKHSDFDHLGLTHKSHFKFGYGPQFLFHPDDQNRWTVAYGSSVNGFRRFDQECERTAHLIRQATSEDIWVLFSGGIDSEVVVRAFHNAGINFKAAILQFNENLNLHDICYAVMVCDQLKIDYTLFPMDLKSFWGSDEYWNYAKISTCVTPQLIPHMWLLDQIPGYPVIGSGEPYYVRANVSLKGKWLREFSEFRGDNSQSGWHLWEKEKIASLFRFFMVRNKKGCPAFFQYTPEIIDSFTYDPSMQNFLRNANPAVLTSFHAKYDLYSQYFPLVKRTKYTGYEKIPTEDNAQRKALHEAFPERRAVYRTKIDVLPPKRKWPLIPSLFKAKYEAQPNVKA